MAKFSVGRLEDGEGPSARFPKKRRLQIQFKSRSKKKETEETIPIEINGSEEWDEEEYQGSSSGEEYEDQEQEVDEVSAEGDLARSRTEPLSVTLADPEVLDCPICYETLSLPVYQCENGHIACTSCCAKILNKCPSCCLPIGYNRCRAIEKVLESIKVKCQNTKYGCKEEISYSETHRHQKICLYAPCTCPLLDCFFLGSSGQLYEHFSANHKDSAIKFQYNRELQISLDVNDRFLVLQEERGDVLFILNNSNESFGNVISLSCIAPSVKEGFSYDILARSAGCILRFKSFTKSIPNLVGNPPSIGCLLVPSDSFGSTGKLKLYLCIWGSILY